jgi:hypothetical protein
VGSGDGGGGTVTATITQHEVALLVDDVSPAFFQLSGGAGKNCTDRPSAGSSTDDTEAVRKGFFAGCDLNHQIHAQPPVVLQWIGAPFRQYLLSDVLAPDFPAEQLKLVIFANAVQVRPDILNAIREKLAVPLRGGGKRTLLFIWTAGIIDGSTGRLDNLGPDKLLGLGLSRGQGELPLLTRLSDAIPTAAAAATAGMFGQPEYSVAPWFHGSVSKTLDEFTQGGTSSSSTPLLCGAPTGDTEVLGHFATNSSPPLPSLLRSAGTDCDVVFSGTPGLPASLYGQLAVQAGVHRWVTGGAAVNVTVEAAAGAIMVHCGRGDAPCDGLLLSLPRVVGAVYADSLSGPIPTVAACSNCTSLALASIESGAVRLFWLED